MIWFLLYPLRGTTAPPRLAPSHPIRRAFQAHGTATAHHWLLSIVLTILISVLLCYPAVFQHDSAAAQALRNLPHHVWTSTTQVSHDPPADVVVRQAWVHGDYMAAVNRTVLRQALHAQHVLIANGFGLDSAPADADSCLVPPPAAKWGWHSPLLYWNCSLSALDGPAPLLDVINSRARDRSASNITLRPSTVFAGKTFLRSKLRAADALVITLFDQTDAGLGHTWDERAGALAGGLSSNWTIFPPDGQVTRSRLYEFRFKKMTLNDDLFLAASYLITAVYVVWRMMQLRAVKSWFGLLITICAKMTICIIASFSLCTYLGVDLARIPRPWFPAVVFCYGLGNIFRLINAVLETPPEMAPHQRIGNALGEVGHLSLAVAFQNLALIWLCSRLVTPWAAEFCVFAAVTLVFDFVYHLTFFVAVLSVDVQRMELSDSLERVDLTQKMKRQDRQSWLAALREGNTPLSTRFAGTVAIFSIILAINWHFFDIGDQGLSFHAVRQRLMTRQKRSVDSFWSTPPINQARTPADWLRLQDHNIARELFEAFKPGASSFVARIYDPILIVARDAQGRDKPQPPSSLLGYLRRFAQGHAFPAALFSVFLIAGVTLLLNYLLWSGLPEDTDEDEDVAFSVKTLSTSQMLDIVSMSSCVKGHLATISLDRSTSIWLHGQSGYLHTTLRTASMKPRLWPIIASALDDNGTVLALCADTGQIGLWSIAASRFLLFPIVDLRGQTPILFSFVNITRNDTEKLYLIIVMPDGHLTELEPHTGIHRTKRISTTPLLCATLYVAKPSPSLVFVCKPGKVQILSLHHHTNTTPEVVASLDPGPPPDSSPEKPKCIHAVPSLGLIVALRDSRAELFDASSRALIHAFAIGHVKPHTFRLLHSDPRRCRGCNAPAVRELGVAYQEQAGRDVVMQVFEPATDAVICLGKGDTTRGCTRLADAGMVWRHVHGCGRWESVGASVVGVRWGDEVNSGDANGDGDDDDESTDDDDAEPRCEAYALSLSGVFTSKPIPLPLVLDHEHDHDSASATVIASSSRGGEAIISHLGPVVRFGKRGLAVAIGEGVVVVGCGREF